MPRPPVDSKLEPLRAKLGNIPDDEIAKAAGVSRSAVVNYRKRLGIPAYEGYKFVSGQSRPAAPAAKAAAPAKPAVKAAAPAPAAKPAKAAKAAEPAPVAAPAPAAKATKSAPAKPAAKPAVKAAAPAPAAPPAPVVVPAPAPAPAAAKAANRQGEFHGRRSKLDPFAELLGKVSDAVVAQKAGVTVENVRAYRARRGIAASRTLEGATTVKTAAAPAPAPKPVVAAAPKAAAPAPAPVVAAPAPKPVVAAEPAPKPVVAAPAPAPKPVVAAPVAAPAPAAPAAAPAAAVARAAFLVTVEEGGEHRSYAVVGADIAEAARLAVEGTRGRGTVRAVSKVADLLA